MNNAKFLRTTFYGTPASALYLINDKDGFPLGELIRHETIFNFHMNNPDTLLKKIAIKDKVITFRNVKSN